MKIRFKNRIDKKTDITHRGNSLLLIASIPGIIAFYGVTSFILNPLTRNGTATENKKVNPDNRCIYGVAMAFLIIPIIDRLVSA